MPVIIPVKFKYATRDLWFDPAESGATQADHVICSTDRGTEIGLATGAPVEVTPEQLRDKTSGAALKPVLRVATDEDLELAESLADRGDEGLPIFRRLVEASGLDMKPVGVEYLFDGSKVVCYFAAEERVDFRQLVRDLSRELHERVDMRQIGVREEAGLVGGFGHCGQELCCARFGCGFDPVSIRMAKEQDLPLNSTKISGACGRLMCCLRYEFEAYRDFKGRAPKKNAVIKTPLGKAKIIEYDTPKEQLALRLENGKQVRVPLSGMEASEAAHKKSEELGCPCRPDTVSREALDALEPSDVQMALADLDRANGIIPEEKYDES
ncbi:MAG: regulatory iron-sulfur-containing complex subunit RicT, partial [Atopobiaceae bacterium]|nr:regulatory iron-sulfur-containing complex subunit RicT [Atopobiaceae bacterium]